MFQQHVKVLYNHQIGPTYYKIGLAGSDYYATAKAGQFIMVQVARQSQPLLRRPFSIHNLIIANGAAEGLEVLYKVVGPATATLARQQPGDRIDILGPLGSGFLIPRQTRCLYLVAGGIGVAPLVFLVSQLARRQFDFSKCRAFIGGRTKEDLLCRSDFEQLGISVLTTTDDGSTGDQCLVTHPVEDALAQIRPDMVVACGPSEMLACLIGITRKYEIPCQVSIETMMACGMGACLGCAVEGADRSDRYLHACLDGPVFDATELNLGDAPQPV
jgi:dihydroorotate dehydrogenase electron transfer subunit